MGVAQYLVKRFWFDAHPSLQTERCINTLQSKRTCTVCQQHCPNGVFAGDSPDWTRCEDCEICVARCPARCLAPSLQMLQQSLQALGQAGAHTLICCKRCMRQGDLTPDCLGALSPDLLLLLLCKGEVRIDDRFCAACENQDRLRHLSLSIAAAQDHLGADFVAGRLSLCSNMGEKEQANHRPSLVRRQAFRSIAQQAGRLGAQALPEVLQQQADGRVYREMWLEALVTQAAIHWRIPYFESGCIGCDICARLCPTGAIEREQTAEDNAITMVLSPWRCTACGLCAEVCPHRAVRPPALYQSGSVQKIAFAAWGKRCTRCGAAMPEGEQTLCAACLAEQKRPAFLQ